MIGTVVSHYRVVAHLGSGGMGLVYKAEDTRLGRPVALKFLAEDLSTSSIALERFRREAQSASALNHPNICTIYDIGEFEGRPFIAMEFLTGGTLRDQLADGPLKISALVEFGVQLADALGAAHLAGILHRDIKPANIFVTGRNQAKILDFGLAKLLSEQEDASGLDLSEQPTMVGSRDQLTNPGSTMGTIAYMSPEQARGEELDASSDLFSLGAVLYEMAARRPAFGGNTSAIIFDAILNRTPAPLRQLNPEVPQALEQIIARLLEKDRNLRYQSAADLESDLRSIGRQSDPAAAVLAPVRSRSRTKFVIPAVVALVVVAAIIAALRLPGRGPVLADRDVVVLADFVNETGDSVFDGTLKEALAIQLEQSRRLNILPDDRAREALQLMARSPDEKITNAVAREICQREGLKAVLGGSLVGLGTNYVVTLNAVNCATGESLAREQRQADSKEKVLAALAEAASNLRVKLGESLPSIQKTDVPTEDKVTTTSLEALRAYTEGMDLNSHGKFRESAQLLEKAVVLDPDFVAAYSSLRIVNGNLGNDAEARKYAAKAFELRDRTSERERLRVTAAYQITVLRNIEKAAETYDLYSRMYPNDYISWNGLALAHRELGRLDESLKEYQEVIRLRSMPLNVNNLGISYLLTGQLAAAKSTFLKAVEEKQDLNGMHATLYEIAFIEGNSDAMQRELDALKVPVSERPPATDLVLLGKLDAVRKRGAPIRPRTELLFGYGTQAENDAKAAFRENATNREDAITAAMAGDSDGVRSLEEQSKQFPEETILNLMDLPTARAAFELHAGHPERVIENLKPLTRFEPASRTLLGIYMRGQAYLLLKSGAGAASEFQKLLSHRNIALRSELFPLSFVGLARAYALGGNLEGARKAYEDFFAIWKDADPNIPVLVQAKAEYARFENRQGR